MRGLAGAVHLSKRDAGVPRQAQGDGNLPRSRRIGLPILSKADWVPSVAPLDSSDG